RELPVSPEHTQALAQYREKVDAIHSELDPIKKKLKSLQDRLKSSANLPGIVVDDREAILVGKWKSSTSVTTYIDEGYLVDDPSGLTEKFARFEVRLGADGEYEVRLAYTPSSNRASNTPVKIMHRDGDTSLTVKQR